MAIIVIDHNQMSLRLLRTWTVGKLEIQALIATSDGWRHQMLKKSTLTLCVVTILFVPSLSTVAQQVLSVTAGLHRLLPGTCHRLGVRAPVGSQLYSVKLSGP